jgi:hypothetical protein
MQLKAEIFRLFCLGNVVEVNLFAEINFKWIFLREVKSCGFFSEKQALQNGKNFLQ